MPFSQTGFMDSPNTAITVLYVVYEKLYYMIIWIWLALYVVDSRIWFPQCNPLWDLRILCFMNVIQNWKLLLFVQNWYYCVQNWNRPFCQMLSTLMQRQLLFWMLQMHQKVNDTFIFWYFPKILFFISASCYVAFDFVFRYNMAKNFCI